MDPLPSGTLKIDDACYHTRLTRKFLHRKSYVAVDSKKILCVIPGVVQEIYVYEGRSVQQGDPLVVVEAMKMRNDVLAAVDAVVKKIHVRVGQQVVKGELLVELCS